MVDKEFTTETGCTVRVTSASIPNWHDDTLRLSLQMKQAGDGRYAEVLLTRDEVTKLRYILNNL